jgi:hypothetical protein
MTLKKAAGIQATGGSFFSKKISAVRLFPPERASALALLNFI